MNTLIDRYVFTALRRVPETQRTDIDRELRASIDDAVDARIEAGEDRDAAIERTLLELGDPDRLADRYADRRTYLIGPVLYPVWRRLMTVMFTIVLPIIVASVIVVQLFDDPTIGSVIGAVVGTVISAGVHLAFWTTLVFVILERTDADGGVLRTTWALKDLPKYQPGNQTRAQLAVTLVWPVLIIVALVLQQFTFTDVPVLDPANWSFWWPYLIAVLLLECAYAVWVFRVGTWTRAVAAANAVLALMSGVPLVWLLATDRFFNPEFHNFFDTGPGDPRHWLSLIVIAVVSLTTIWDIVDVTIKAERIRRGLPTKIAGSGNSYTV